MRSSTFGPMVSAAAFVAVSLPGISPAHATVLPTGRVNVTLVTGGFKACVSGSADPVLNLIRQWEFVVAGARSNGTVISHIQGGSGTTFAPPCYTVTKGGTASGQFFATLTYGGVGVDMALVLVGSGTWSALTGDQVTGMERPTLPTFEAVG